MSRSAISEVDVHAAEGDDLLGFHLDAPQAGASHDAYAFDIRGWVLGRRNRVTSVEVKDGPRLLWRVPVDIVRQELAGRFPQASDMPAGFFTILNSLQLEREFEVHLRARLDDASRVPLATLRGSREPLDTGFEPRIDPLMVTTLGRTGSTILMKVLAAHPEVVVCAPFEHEPRVATYWLGVMSTLTDPVSYRRQINPTGTIDGTWWVGAEPPLPRRPKDPRLERWMNVEAVREIAAFCQGRIEAVYSEVAAEDGVRAPRYFAEKYRPDHVSTMMRELYPRAREVVLVRDFRDMVASMFAYNVKRGRQGFRRGEFDDDAQYVAEQVKPSVAALASAWEARRSDAHLVRYEDLVQNPLNTIGGLLEHLGLDTGPAGVMAAALTARDPETEWHRTTPEPAASIGRWRNDLPASVQRACEEVLAPELRAFGYPLEKAAV